MTMIHRWLHQPLRQQIRSRNHLRGRLHQQLTARQVLTVNADQINAIRRLLDFLSKVKSRFNILLNILQSLYIAMMFLRTVFFIFALQTIFRIPEQSC